MVPDDWSMCDRIPGTHFLVRSGLEVGRPLRRMRRVLGKRSGPGLLLFLLSPNRFKLLHQLGYIHC